MEDLLEQVIEQLRIANLIALYNTGEMEIQDRVHNGIFDIGEYEFELDGKPTIEYFTTLHEDITRALRI